jgi:hypothetical protein
MGVVFEAFDRERAQRVAIKTLHLIDPSSVYQLKNEFRSLVDFSHPNVVKLQELFEEHGKYFFSMDLVDGVRFDEWVRVGTSPVPGVDFNEGRLRAAFGQLIGAVVAIHASGKLHRDLKPNNVLVTTSGRIVVLDFGLVVEFAFGSIGQTVDDGSISGTPEYMAPEAAVGAVTAASDYYSLGVMLFEALTGRLPFVGTVHEILTDKQRFDAPFASACAAGAAVPKDLDALCARLLSRDPVERKIVTEHQSLATSTGPASNSTRLESPVEAQELYGREKELAQLGQAYDAWWGGTKPVVILLAGESGIGKSALVEAFLRPLRNCGHEIILSGRCFERESVPFKGFDIVVDQLSRYLRQLTAEQASALLPRDAFALRRLFPVLGRIDAIAHAPVRDVADPYELRRRAFCALGELFARISDRRPVILHLDDIQWSDADSTTLLLHLIRQVDAPRLLLLVSHRSEEMRDHACIRPIYEILPADVRVDVRVVRLEPLSLKASRRLLQARGCDHLGDELVATSGGNPFLLGELARFAASHTDRTISDVSVPSIVRTRAAALGEPERRLLEVLAVAGKPLALPLAIEAAGGSSAGRVLFDRLRTENLARATGDEFTIECYHDRVREAVIEQLSTNTVRNYHSALAVTLAKAPYCDPEQIASHLVGAGDSQSAGDQFLVAARRAEQELGFDRAARLYSLALEHRVFDSAELRRIQLEHAATLAHAGRGSEAADAYIAACSENKDEQATELKLLAAEQCLYAGHIARGSDLLNAALRERGLSVPLSTAALIGSIAYHDTRLRLRNHRWAPRRQTAPRVSARIDALRRAASVILRTNPLRAAEFGLRGALMALRWGDERAAGQALTSVLVAVVVIGGSESVVAAAMRSAEEMAASSSDLATRSWWFYGRGLARLQGPCSDTEGALDDFERCIELLGEPKHPGASHNRVWCEWFRALALVRLARFSETSDTLLAHFDDAWNRNDLSLVPVWAGRIAAVTSIACDDVKRAEWLWTKARGAWTSTQVSVQEKSLCEAAVLLHTHANRAREAWECAENWYQRLKQSPFRRSHWFWSDAQFSRGITALALAMRCQSGAERDRLLRTAVRVHRESGLTIIGVGLACARGDRASAIATLRLMDAKGFRRQSGVHGSWCLAFVQALRRRLGQLEQTAGVERIAIADMVLRAGGVRDPEKFVACLLPALEIE